MKNKSHSCSIDPSNGKEIFDRWCLFIREVIRREDLAYLPYKVVDMDLGWLEEAKTRHEKFKKLQTALGVFSKAYKKLKPFDEFHDMSHERITDRVIFEKSLRGMRGVLDDLVSRHKRQYQYEKGNIKKVRKIRSGRKYYYPSAIGILVALEIFKKDQEQLSSVSKILVDYFGSAQPNKENSTFPERYVFEWATKMKQSLTRICITELGKKIVKKKTKAHLQQEFDIFEKVKKIAELILESETNSAADIIIPDEY